MYAHDIRVALKKNMFYGNLYNNENDATNYPNPFEVYRLCFKADPVLKLDDGFLIHAEIDGIISILPQQKSKVLKREV